MLLNAPKRDFVLILINFSLDDGRNPEWLLSRLRPLTSMSVLREHITLWILCLLDRAPSL